MQVPRDLRPLRHCHLPPDAQPFGAGSRGGGDGHRRAATREMASTATGERQGRRQCRVLDAPRSPRIWQASRPLGRCRRLRADTLSEGRNVRRTRNLSERSTHLRAPLRCGCAGTSSKIVAVTETLGTHKIALARDLMDDVELSRLPPEQLVLKASRLARILESKSTQEWLRFELEGYRDTESGRDLMSRTGRWVDSATKRGWWAPLAQIEGTIAATKLEMQQLQIPSIHYAPQSANTSEWVTGFGGVHVQSITKPLSDAQARLQNLNHTLSQLTGIRSRVLALLHDFVSSAYYELAFGEVAEAMFDTFKRDVDELLRDAAGQALEKIPFVVDRIAVGDPEAVSQGLTTCRRVVDAFATAIYPPSDVPVVLDGKEWDVGPSKPLNRIDLFLRKHCPSESRRDRLKKTVRAIWERTSTGVHDNVAPEEARSLFLLTYLTLGELLLLRQAPVAAQS